MSFFSSGGNEQANTSYSGLRSNGLDLSPQMSNYILNTLPKNTDQAFNMFMNPNSFLQGGLYAEQNAMIPTLVNLAGNKFSANGASRGMLSPENNGAIAGSVATNLSPVLMSMISDNINNLRNAGGNMFLGGMNDAVSSLGSGSTGYSKSANPGIGYNMANQFFNNAMEGFSAPKMMSAMGGGGGIASMGAMCWIAQELYGANDERVSIIRDYINSMLSSDSLIGQFARWYVQNGKAIADGIGSGLDPRPWQHLFHHLYQISKGDSRMLVLGMG